MRTISYGPLPDQIGDLYLPDEPCPLVACLLHGGFWRMPFGRHEMSAVASDLVMRGFAVWNLEYRRLGVAGGGWPGTFQDVGAGIDHLAKLAADGVAVDLNRIVVIGHSAGGHLALWSAQRDATRSNGYGPKRVKVVAAVGLAPVADLVCAHEHAAGSNAVAALMDGSPDQQADRYRTSSPIAMLPLGVRQLVIHGTADDVLPIKISACYAQAAIAAGDDVRFVALEGAGHMDFLDVTSEAYAAVCRELLAI